MESKPKSSLPNILLLKVPDFLYNRTRDLTQVAETHTFGEINVYSNGKV